MNHVPHRRTNTSANASASARTHAIAQAPLRLPYAAITVAFGLVLSTATAISMPLLIG